MTKRFSEDESPAAPLTERQAAFRAGDLLETSGPPSTARDPNAHLSDEEFVGIVLDDLPSTEALAVSLHLDHCEACARALVHHYEASDEFDRLHYI